MIIKESILSGRNYQFVLEGLPTPKTEIVTIAFGLPLPSRAYGGRVEFYADTKLAAVIESIDFWYTDDRIAITADQREFFRNIELIQQSGKDLLIKIKFNK